MENYIINKKLGSGSFGEVFLALCVKKNILVALKMEPKEKNTLKHEWDIYAALKDTTIRIPMVYNFFYTDTHSVMSMELLGKSLSEYFEDLGSFSLKTVLMLGIQMVDIVHSFHFAGYLHRDVKPDNFLLGGAKKRHLLYLIDYGLTKRFKHNNVHIKSASGKKLIGTARYAGINSHLGVELSRRDDLESIGYILVYFLVGTLPWQGAAGKTREERYQSIGEIKLNTPLDILCAKCPVSFKAFLKYCKTLEFSEKPNYLYLRNLLLDEMSTHNMIYDYNYDF